MGWAQAGGIHVPGVGKGVGDTGSVSEGQVFAPCEGPGCSASPGDEDCLLGHTAVRLWSLLGPPAKVALASQFNQNPSPQYLIILNILLGSSSPTTPQVTVHHPGLCSARVLFPLSSQAPPDPDVSPDFHPAPWL